MRCFDSPEWKDALEQEGKKKAKVLVPNLAQQLYEEDHDMYMNALLALRSIRYRPWGVWWTCVRVDGGGFRG